MIFKYPKHIACKELIRITYDYQCFMFVFQVCKQNFLFYYSTEKYTKHLVI
jgi:hypothetical protein